MSEDIEKAFGELRKYGLVHVFNHTDGGYGVTVDLGHDTVVRAAASEPTLISALRTAKTLLDSKFMGYFNI